MKVGFISLGCSKNLVDTEMTIGLFKKNNFEIVNSPEDAEIIVINTCGFIESAKEEGINTILEMCEYKKQNCKYVIVMGCLVQRYKEELAKEIPEVDLFIKYDSYNTIWDQISKVITKKEGIDNYKNLEFDDRIITTGNTYAYVRIAEGCNNGCSFCAIPHIRGKYVSRKIEDIIKEEKSLVSQGIKELILIAQDTGRYGLDLYGEKKLLELLEKTSKIEGLERIRFLYTYPETIDDKLLEVIKNNENITPYFDIPIQHISNNILKAMKRFSTSERTREIIKKIRKDIPEAIIRTTVMVGFPGETENDFNELYDFIKEARFDKLGCFTYSPEEGTLAEKMDNQIVEEIKQERYQKIMSLQQEISKENLKEKIGKKYKVLLEDYTEDGKYLLGRSYMEAPDIDGLFYIENDNKAIIGDFVNAKVIDTNEYDLIAKVEEL